MNILLLLLPLILKLLPKLLEWLLSSGRKGTKAGGRALKQLNEAVWYCDQIAAAAPKVGATKGGVPPETEVQPARKRRK